MDISRQALFGKLNGTLFKSLESATVFCKLRGNPHVELVHWIHQLLQSNDTDITRVMRYFNIDQGVLEQHLAQSLLTLPNGASSIHDFSVHVVDAVERAWVYATLCFSSNTIRGIHLFAALVKTPDLRRQLLAISDQFRAFPVDTFMDVVATAAVGSPEEHEQASDGTALGVVSAGTSTEPYLPGEMSQATAGAQPNNAYLARFCSDITERARTGQLDPVVGREREIRAMIDILLRRRQNNPLLTGDAGVGKTAIVEGLALALARGEVPPALASVRLLGLDVGALLAGASMKGEFESRLRGLIEEAGRSPVPIVLFVDEVHTLVGAGGSQGTGDAANLLKPALARGTLRTIGATTWSEYKKYIEKDPALTRRFQVLQVGEPDENTGIEMVRGLVDTFHAHHKVLILDEAVQAAVRLSARYIPARQLPDKAISLLDTACAKVGLSLNAPPPEVEHARRCLNALHVEQTLLQQELRVITAADHPRQQRFQAIVAELDAQQGQLDDLESRWRTELALVRQLLEAREQLLTAPDIPDAPDVSDVSETVPENTGIPNESLPGLSGENLIALQDIEEQLAQLQHEQALVHPEVDSRVVAEVVADWTGIPVGRMVRDDLRAVLELPQVLRQRIVGQDAALHSVARRIQTSRAQLTDPNKPIGVFLLVGPSGVGKTETALALAEALYGGEQNLITVNMSEFQEAHTVSTLKGAPPGYVGYGEGGVLTEAVRRRPHSVILLDEIEKAHSDVYELFYQVFDKGWMEDGQGSYIDFKNTVMLLTTNVGSELSAALCVDPQLLPDPEALAEALLPELRKVFPAAFLGRLTVVPYYPLGEEYLASIVDIHLGRIAQRLQRHHGVTMEYDAEVKAWIIEHCHAAETGARLIIGFIEQHVLPEMSRLWLEHMGEGHGIARVRLCLADQRVVCVALPDHTESVPLKKATATV